MPPLPLLDIFETVERQVGRLEGGEKSETEIALSLSAEAFEESKSARGKSA